MSFNNAALLELCHYLLPEDPSLAKEVRLSIQKPKFFLIQIKHVLRDWIKNEPIEEMIPWYTLIHGLYQRGLIFELSARTAAEHMDQHTNRLLLEAWPSYSYLEPPKPQYLVDTFLQISSHYLQTANYTLGEIRLSSGVSVVTMIPQNAKEKCSELMKRSGYGEIVFHSPSSNFKSLEQCTNDYLCENA